MTKRLLVALVSLVFVPASVVGARGQSDEMPLGDIARQLRKSQPPPRTVIDNDNLPAVMEDGESRKWIANGLRFSPDPLSIKIGNSSSPDVTCALTFNAPSSDPVEELKPQSLPDTEVAKLDGPAAIVGDSLQISVYNGTGWNVREITVGLTLVKKQRVAQSANYGAVKLITVAMNDLPPTEKHSDTTILYHLKGMAAPSTTTLFHETLNAPLDPDQEWHWAIVQAKGIPPYPAPQPPD